MAEELHPVKVPAQVRMSRLCLAVIKAPTRGTGKQKDLSSIPPRLSTLFSNAVVCVGLSVALQQLTYCMQLTVGLLETGAQDDHLDFHTAPELCVVCGTVLGLSYHN